MSKFTIQQLLRMIGLDDPQTIELFTSFLFFSREHSLFFSLCHSKPYNEIIFMLNLAFCIYNPFGVVM